MAITLTDLTKQSIGLRQAGIAGKVYFARLSDIDTFPTPTVGTTYESKFNITTDITFQAGKGWNFFYTTSEKGNLVVKGSEERDTVGGMATVTVQIPNDTANVLGLLDELQKDEFVFLIFDGLCQTGQHRVMGSECKSALVKFEANSGTTSQDARTTSVTIEYPAIPYFYSGTVTLAPAP